MSKISILGANSYIARNYISNDKLIRFEDARLIKLEIEKGED